MEQILLLHPDSLLVLCEGRSTDGRQEGREDSETQEERKFQIRTKCFFQDFSMYPFINLILGFTNKLRDASLFF